MTGSCWERASISIPSPQHLIVLKVMSKQTVCDRNAGLLIRAVGTGLDGGKCPPPLILSAIGAKPSPSKDLILILAPRFVNLPTALILKSSRKLVKKASVLCAGAKMQFFTIVGLHSPKKVRQEFQVTY